MNTLMVVAAVAVVVMVIVLVIWAGRGGDTS